MSTTKILTVPSTATLATVQTLDLKAADGRVRFAVAVHFATLNGTEGKEIAAATGKSVGYISTMRNGGALIVRVGEAVTPAEGRTVLAYVEGTNVKDREWIGEDLNGSDLVSEVTAAEDARKAQKAGGKGNGTGGNGKGNGTLSGKASGVLSTLASISDADMSGVTPVTAEAFVGILAHALRLGILAGVDIAGTVEAAEVAAAEAEAKATA